MSNDEAGCISSFERIGWTRDLNFFVELLRDAICDLKQERLTGIG